MATDTIIKIGLYDVTAKKDATVTTNSKQSFTDLDQLKDEVINVNKYATLEQNRFLLDDTFNEFPDDPTSVDLGYWSGFMSDQNGDFATNPNLTFEFTQNHSSIGLTLDSVSNGDFDFDVHIKWFDSGDNILHEGDYTIKQGIHVLYEKVDNYRKIEIEFIKTSVPYRWVKLDYIAFGVLLSYNGTHIINAKLVEEVNPMSFVVPIDTLKFKLFSRDKDFSLANPKGIYTALQQSQQVTVTGNIKGNSVHMGTFYLEDWQQENEQTSKFTALDAIGILDKTIYKDGSVYVDTAAEEIVDNIMLSAGWENYVLDDALKSKTLTGWLKISTHRQALQQVAFALGATVKADRDNFIRIFVPDETVSKTITRNRKFIGSKSDQIPLVTDVEILSHNYELLSSSEEIYNAELDTGTYEITFNEPYQDITVNNATITKSATNYVIIEVTGQQTVTVSAKKYNDNTVKVFNTLADLPAGAIKNTVEIKDCTLLDLAKAKELAPKIMAYFQNRRVDIFSMVIDEEKTSDFVTVESIGGINLNGRIEKLSIDLAGGYRSKVKVVGKNEVV